MKRMKREPHGPGVVLREILEEMGMSQEKLAHELGVSFRTVSEIINGHRTLTAELAVKLAHKFDTTPEYWANQQLAVSLYRAEAEFMKASA